MRPLCEFKRKEWTQPCGAPSVDYWVLEPKFHEIGGKLWEWPQQKRWFCSYHYDLYAHYSTIFPELKSLETEL